MIDRRRCTRCGHRKPLSAFPPDPRLRLGVGSWCLACKAVQKAIWEARPEVRQRRREQQSTARAKRARHEREKRRRSA